MVMVIAAVAAELIEHNRGAQHNTIFVRIFGICRICVSSEATLTVVV